MTTLLLGADGLLGSAIYQDLAGTSMLATSRHGLPGTIRYEINCDSNLSEIGWQNISRVIVCIAASKVAFCEKNPELTWTINTHRPLQIVDLCCGMGIPVTVFSSEYVFDGESEDPYIEKSETMPKTIYGMQKAYLEKEVCNNYPKALILRISKLASLSNKRSFLCLMKSDLSTNKTYSAAKDQVFTPICLKDAVNLINIAHFKGLTGLFNLCGQTTYTRFQLANLLKERCGVDCAIISTSMKELRLPYLAPANLSMDSSLLHSACKYSCRSIEQLLENLNA